MASTTKLNGTGHLMWPDDSNSESIQNDLFVAIEQAMKVLSWQENLIGDEMPPSWMWHLDWEIEEWFKKIKIERDRKYGNNKGQGDGTDSGGEGMFEENVFFDRVKNGE